MSDGKNIDSQRTKVMPSSSKYKKLRCILSGQFISIHRQRHTNSTPEFPDTYQPTLKYITNLISSKYDKT